MLFRSVCLRGLSLPGGGWGVGLACEPHGCPGLTLGRLPVCCPSVSSLVTGVVEWSASQGCWEEDETVNAKGL